MDEIDRSLISMLASDARQPVATMAKKLSLARSTTQARIERLERDKVIAGYTIRMGAAAGRSRIFATVLLQVEPQATASVLSRLKTMTEVERAYSASGRFDLILNIAAPSPQDLDHTLDQIGEIPGLRMTESLIHLGTKIDRAAL